MLNFREYIYNLNAVVSEIQFVEPNKYHININSFYIQCIQQLVMRPQEESKNKKAPLSKNYY